MSLADYSPWGCRELDVTGDVLDAYFFLHVEKFAATWQGGVDSIPGQGTKILHDKQATEKKKRTRFAQMSMEGMDRPKLRVRCVLFGREPLARTGRSQSQAINSCREWPKVNSHVLRDPLPDQIHLPPSGSALWFLAGPGYVDAGTLSPLTIPGSRALVADGHGTAPAPPVPRGDSRMLSEADMSWLPWKRSCAPMLMAGHERHSRQTR